MPTILLVDDDPDQLALLRRLLNHPPYTLLAALNAGDALRVMQERLPDLILLDIAMPDVSGLQFLQYLRITPRFASLKVIFVTAVPIIVSQEAVASVHGVLVKPFFREQLETTVRMALGTPV